MGKKKEDRKKQKKYKKKCGICFRKFTKDKTDSIYRPYQCRFCEKYFCINCMYLVCFICHQTYSCFHCGRDDKERNQYRTRHRCSIHLNLGITEVNCMVGEECGCRNKLD